MNNADIQEEGREIPLYWPGNCFACSKSNAMGLHLRFWTSDNNCLTRCTISENHCGFEGMVHGGIISTLIDEVAAWTIITQIAKIGLTTELGIRYFKPVPTGREIIVRGKIIKHDELNAEVLTTVKSTKGVLLAEGECKWIFPKLAVVARLGKIDESVLQKFLEVYQLRLNVINLRKI